MIFPEAFKRWLLALVTTCPHDWELVVAGRVEHDGRLVDIRLDQCRFCNQTQIRAV